jgi:hypothetical protein
MDSQGLASMLDKDRGQFAGLMQACWPAQDFDTIIWRLQAAIAHDSRVAAMFLSWFTVWIGVWRTRRGGRAGSPSTGFSCTYTAARHFSPRFLTCCSMAVLGPVDPGKLNFINQCDLELHTSNEQACSMHYCQSVQCLASEHGSW